MSTESSLKAAVGFFVIIVLGALLSSILGGGFGAVIARISPEFVRSLFNLDEADGAVRYSFAVGMIWGLFIGAAVSGFACLLAAVIKILRVRFDSQRQQT